MNEILRNGCLLLGMTGFSACQSGGPVEGINLNTSHQPLPLIATIGKTIQKCWFQTKNPAFNAFRLANESNSYAGRPRLLLVPKNKPTGLPSLVIQAEAGENSTNLQAYGPLLTTKTGELISTDLKNWIAGSTACAT